MSKLNVEKLRKYKKENCYTNKQISNITKIPIATIDRIFSGANKNPTLNILEKLAALFKCPVDDFIEYDQGSPLADYYENKQTKKLAQEIHDNPDLRILLDATKDLPLEDLKAVIDIANRIKGTNNE